MVSTHLKNISQNGNSPNRGENEKNWNHQREHVSPFQIWRILLTMINFWGVYFLMPDESPQWRGVFFENWKMKTIQNYLDPDPHVVWCCLIIFRVGLERLLPLLGLVLKRNPFWPLGKRNDHPKLCAYIIHYTVIHMGVSKNSGTPKWMVYKGKPY